MFERVLNTPPWRGYENRSFLAGKNMFRVIFKNTEWINGLKTVLDMFIVNNKNTTTTPIICFYGLFIVNFEQIEHNSQHNNLAFLLY